MVLEFANMTQRGRLTMRQSPQNETTPLRHPFASLCELAGSEPGNSLEQAGKMLRVVKAQQMRGLVDIVAVHQKVLALLYHE